MFFYFFNVFCAFLISCFCCCYNINVQNYKYDAFLLGKLRLALFSICTTITRLHNTNGLVRVRHTPFPGQSECFVAVLLTLFDSY